MPLNKIALIVCLDSNSKKNLYEQEFIKCIQHWKKNAKELSCIDIYVYIQKNTKLLSKTVSFIRSTANIKVIYYTIDFQYLFLNTLYCQFLFEKKFQGVYDYSIYIDLDMYLQKPLPMQLFNDKTILSYYDLRKFDDQPNLMHRLIYNINHRIYTFNTYFIINRLKLKLFEQLFKLTSDKQYIDFFNAYYFYKNDSYFFEEGIYDYAYNINVLNNMNCMFFSTNVISDSNKALFKHEHIMPVKAQLQFLKIKQHII